ncbi:LCP family protein [Amycolatopsis sp. cg5]|uniref:LCP family protein n=1 Tax=Amycolatopsis sp. cg5 TaxID=3238802 RepID=UPI003525D875
MTEWPPKPIPAPRRRRDHGAGTLARRGGKTLVSLVSIAVLTVTWYGWQFIGDPNEGLATTDVFENNQLHAKPLDGAIDILLVGQDSRTDAQGNPLSREVLDMLHGGISDGERQTDTMILVHIPQDGRRAIAISFPRDSWVEITGGFGKHRLNSAYVYAYNDTSKTLQQQGNSDLKDVDGKAKIAGRKNLIQTLETFIGKPGMIDRYAEVNLASFYEVTKAIGGIDVCLNAPVKERLSGVDLPAGRQSIEGAQALSFVRQRHGLPNGDLDRIVRQQAFLSGLANKVLSGSVLANPFKISELVDAVKKSVVLSAGWDLFEFAEQMRGLTGGNIEFHTIPTQGNANIGGADVLRVDPVEVRAAVAKLVHDPNAPEEKPGAKLAGAEAVTVDLFDGTGSGLGDATRQALSEKGFLLGENTKLAARNTTVVRYAPGDEASVELVKQVLGESVELEPDRDVAKGHARVLLGKDFKGVTTPTSTPPTSSSAPKPSATPTSSASASPTPEQKPITAGGVPCVN